MSDVQRRSCRAWWGSSPGFLIHTIQWAFSWAPHSQVGTRYLMIPTEPSWGLKMPDVETKPGCVVRAASGSTTEVMGRQYLSCGAMERVAGELVIATGALVPASGGCLRKFHWAMGADDDKKQV